jgi:hypothetical protein
MARRLSLSPPGPSDHGVGRAGRGRVDALDSVDSFARFRHHDFVKVWWEDGDNGLVAAIVAERLLTCVILAIAWPARLDRWSRSVRARAREVVFVHRDGS